MSHELHVRRGVRIPIDEIELRVSRSSGPGGQHANKTESRVEAVLDVVNCSALGPRQRARVIAKLGPVVTAVAQDERSQLRNRELALDRLSQKLAAALVVQRVRRPTKPTRASKERRLEAKRRRTDIKQHRRKPPSTDE